MKVVLGEVDPFDYDFQISAYGPRNGSNMEHGDPIWEPNGKPIEWTALDPDDGMELSTYYRNFLSDSEEPRPQVVISERPF